MDTLSTGIVLVILAEVQGESISIQRAPDVSGVPGTFADYGVIVSCDQAGSPFFDAPLPLDGTTYWYRSQGKESGYLDSSYSTPISAEAAVIDPTIDFSSKPWEFNSTIPLSLVMSVIADTTGSVTVSSSVNRDPASSTQPLVSLASYTGLPTNPTLIGVGTWLIQKPSSGSGTAVFTNTLAGRLSGYDGVVVEPVALLTSSSFLSVSMHQVSSSATSVTVSSSVYNPAGYPVGVSLDSYSNLTPTRLSPGIWTLGRPSASSGTAVFSVTSSNAATVPDFEAFFVDSQNLTPLSVTGVILSETTSSVTGRFDVTDPYTPSGSIAGITTHFVSQSAPNFSASIGTVTNTNGVYSVAFSTTRGSYAGGANTSYLTMIASKSGYTPEEDSVTILENVSNLGHLTARLVITGESANTVTVSGSGNDPISGSAAPTLTFSLNPGGTFTGVNPWTVNRPLSSSIQAQLVVSSPNRVPDAAYATIATNVAAYTVSSSLALLFSVLSQDGTTVTYTSSVSNPGHVAVSNPYLIFADTSNGASVAISSGDFVFTRPYTSVAAFTYGVSSSVAGIYADTHTLYIPSTNMYQLSVNAIPVSSTDTTVTVDVVVSDPLDPSRTGLADVTMTVTNSENSGLSATLDSTTENMGNTVYRYTLTRSDYGTGPGRYSFTASKSGYQSESDAADVPESNVLSLGINAQTIASDSTTQTVAVTGSCFVGGDAPTLTLIGNPGSLSVSAGTPSSTTGATSITTNTWVVTRPDTLPASLTFEASRTGQQSIHIDQQILPQAVGSGGGGSTYISAFYVSSVDQSGNQVVLTFAGSPPSGGSLSIMGDAAASWGPDGVTETGVSGTSYDFPLGVFDISAGKSGAWENIALSFTMIVKNSGGSVVQTMNAGSSVPGTEVL
ncbi:MAG TPA: hypothetical protein VGM77_11125 [Gemmatimonadales bacterium]|jgi:hypothetical protein